VAAFNQAGWLVIVVTNQSGVGRGYYTEDACMPCTPTCVRIWRKPGGHIDAFYYAPQHPEAPVEAYRHPDPPLRKPNPGMILQALARMAHRPRGLPADRRQAVGPGGGGAGGIRGVLFEGGDWRSS